MLFCRGVIKLLFCTGAGAGGAPPARCAGCAVLGAPPSDPRRRQEQV